MPVPLFDTRTPVAPLRGAIEAKLAEVIDASQLHPRSRGEGVRGRVRRLPRRPPRDRRRRTGPTRSRSRCARMGVGPGDEVVVPSFTFYASAEAIPPTGARPVFCDVDPETFCVTAETVRAALTPRTKAVMVVHLFGNVAPVAEIEALGVPVLEDAAQASARSASDRPRRRARHGGDVLVLPVQEPRRVRRRRRGGHRATTRSPSACGCCASTARATRQTFELVGHNSRLDELQAAILRVQLPHLDDWADGRRRGAAHYREAGLGELVDLPLPVDGCEPAWHLYVVRHQRADELAAALKAAGIGHKAYYRVPTHQQPAMREYAPAGRAAGHGRGRAHPPGDPDEPGALARAGRRGRRRGARCGSGSTSLTRRTCSSCARSSGRSSSAGAEVLVTARDFAQTLELCERHGIAVEAIGHHRGGRLAAKGARPAVALGGARALGARAADRRRARPRVQRRHGRRARCCGIPSATAFDYEWAKVQHTVNCRLARAVVVPDAIPPERLRRYGATDGQAAALPGAEGGVLPGGLRARPGGARRARARSRSGRSPSCARRRRSRSTTASRTRCSRRCSTACAASRPWCSRARPSSAPSSAASSSPSARSTRSRWSPTPTWSSPPAAR